VLQHLSPYNAPLKRVDAIFEIASFF
jgi:hypothetical protein